MSEKSTAIVKAQSSNRNLRKRELIVEDKVLPPPKRLIVARKNIITPKLSNALKSELVEGLVVLAKMRTYAAWPARIESFKKTCVNVHFFGDDTSGNVPYENIGLFGANHELIKHNLTKTIKGYIKAVRCAEIALSVPSNLSILNTIDN